MQGRIIATIVLSVAWLCFVLLYLAFWTTGLSLFQSVAVFIVSLLVLGGLLGVMWVRWGMKMAEEAAKPKLEGSKKK
jgi:hypothetical protein